MRSLSFALAVLFLAVLSLPSTAYAGRRIRPLRFVGRLVTAPVRAVHRHHWNVRAVRSRPSCHGPRCGR